MHKHKMYSRDKMFDFGFIGDLWNSFWNGPDAKCPKCGNHVTEYYDPFFFAPIRTLKGKRRIKCTSCLFIWRPSKNGKSVLGSI